MAVSRPRCIINASALRRDAKASLLIRDSRKRILTAREARSSGALGEEASFDERVLDRSLYDIARCSRV